MIEEVSKVASDAVKGLSAQPILLLIALLNVGMLAALIYVANAQSAERKYLGEQRDAMITTLLKQCGPADGIKQ